MLTRSPIPASSSAASPRSVFPVFHYAPAPSPRQSPTWGPPAAPTRQSACSPSVSRPRRYVAVDAATQYSPMEPIDNRTGAPRVPSAVAHDAGLDSPPALASQPMTLQGTIPNHDPLSSHDTGVPISKQPIPAISRETTGMSAADPAQPSSPIKRRKSQGSGEAVATSWKTPAPSVRDSPALVKRPRPALAPQKILSTRYEMCAPEDMVVLIAHMLGELIETNDGLALQSGSLTRFHSRTAPGISVLDYLHRLAKHATITPPLLLSMVYYIDRLCAMYPEFTINTLTVHRFLITAATVAAKGLSDAFWNNSTYARVGGIRVAELKLLELEFLCRVDWKIVPNPEVLVAYYRGLVDRCPGYQLEPDQEEEYDDEEEEDSSDMLDDDEDVAEEGVNASEDDHTSSEIEGDDRANASSPPQ